MEKNMESRTELNKSFVDVEECLSFNMGDVENTLPLSLCKGFIEGTNQRWLNGKQAELLIPLYYDGRRRVNRISIEINALVVKGHPQTLSISGNGIESQHIKFNFETKSHKIEINISQKHEGPIKIHFESQKESTDPIFAFGKTQFFLMPDQQINALKQEIKRLKKTPFDNSLLEAVSENDIPVEDRLKQVEMLVALGANINARNKQGQTPALLSLLNDYFYIAQFLIERKKADLSIVDMDNNNIIDSLAIKGDYKHLQWLIDQHSRSNGIGFLQEAYRKIQSIEGEGHDEVRKILRENMLIIAVKQNNVSEAKAAIFEFKADIDAQDRMKETALHKASYIPQLEMVQFLLEAGAKTDIMDTYGTTASKAAKTDEIEYLIKHYELLRLIKVGNKEELDKLLPAYKILRFKDETHKYGHLIMAALNMSKEIDAKIRLDIIALLLQHDIKANILVHGTTPLHEAVRLDDNGDNKEIIKLLIKEESQKNLQNDSQEKPIDYAVSLNKLPLAFSMTKKFQAMKTENKLRESFFGKSGQVSETACESENGLGL